MPRTRLSGLGLSGGSGQKAPLKLGSVIGAVSLPVKPQNQQAGLASSIAAPGCRWTPQAGPASLLQFLCGHLSCLLLNSPSIRTWVPHTQP